MTTKMTAPVEETVTIEEKDISSIIRKKKNWSSPDTDKITSHWIKTLSYQLHTDRLQRL